MQIRTVAVILVWIVVVLLLINKPLRSGWLWLISGGLLAIAFIVFSLPWLRRKRGSEE
ncbi:MAG: hypothetical protein PVF96_06670 [Candidatus Bathyarchaeota archaeon]